MKQIKIYKLTSVDPPEHTGSIYDPHPWAEFMQMYDTGEWLGGYVEGRGYIPQYINVNGSSIMVIGGGSGYSSNYYYPYCFFLPINTTIHHTFYGIVLTDIAITANIDVYRLTVKVSITKKGDYDIWAPSVNLVIGNFDFDEIQNDFSQLADNIIFCGEKVYDLPHDSLSSSSISLNIDCNYNHENETDPLPQQFIIYSEY